MQEKSSSHEEEFQIIDVYFLPSRNLTSSLHKFQKLPKDTVWKVGGKELTGQWRRLQTLPLVTKFNINCHSQPRVIYSCNDVMNVAKYYQWKNQKKNK